MIQQGVDLVRSFEGYSSVPYLCPANVWTIGYGTTRYPDGTPVTGSDPACNTEQATTWLNHELNYAELKVYQLTTVYLNPNQVAALASFVYNLGAGAFRASTLRRKINPGDFDEVPYQLSRWVYASGRRLQGLVRRRAAEAKLWGLQHE